MRYRSAIGVGLAATLLVPAAPAPAQAASSTDELRRVVVKRINGLRADNGVRRMRRSKSLTRSASAYAAYMMSRGYFGHASSIRAPRRYSSLGEIILMHRGAHGRPRVAVRGWAHSSGHRAVMLSSRYRQMGVGIASGRFNGRRMTIWVTHVGRR